MRNSRAWLVTAIALLCFGVFLAILKQQDCLDAGGSMTALSRFGFCAKP